MPFRERFTLGALVTFLITVADVPIFNVGAPFRGLVVGYAVSRLLERKDFGAAGTGCGTARDCLQRTARRTWFGKSRSK